MKRRLLLPLLLPLLALAQGMFNLPEGSWNGKVQTSQLNLVIGDSQAKTMKMEVITPQKAHLVFDGTYKVTSNKGGPQFLFEITKASAQGLPGFNPKSGYDLGKWHLAVGTTGRYLLHYGDQKSLHMDIFDPETLECVDSVDLTLTPVP